MIIAIDTSGSTSSRFRDYLDETEPSETETIFSVEKKIAKLIQTYYGVNDESVTYIGWDDDAVTYSSLNNIVLVGQGTTPDCLYTNQKFKDNMNTQHIVLFTDGMIDDNGISNFYKSMAEKNTNAVFTFCIVSGRKNTKVADIDVSVAFPVISLARKATFLYYDPNFENFCPRVIHTINTDFKCPDVTDASKWSDYPYLTDTNLCDTLEFTQNFTSHHAPIPLGKIRLDDAEYDDICYASDQVDVDEDTLYEKILQFRDNYVLATFVYKCKNDLQQLARTLRFFINKKNCDFCKTWAKHINSMRKGGDIGTSCRVFSCSR